MIWKIILWGVGLVVALFVLLWLNAIRAGLSRNRKIYRRLKPIWALLDENPDQARSTIQDAAADPVTRKYLIDELRDRNKIDWFPEEYLATEKLAETDLVVWLMHGNELGVAPAQIEPLKSIRVEEASRQGTCFLFRFRAPDGHWAAENGWMAGVAGPFWDNDRKETSGRLTFSELQPLDARTEEEHLDFLTKAARKWGLVVPS